MKSLTSSLTKLFICNIFLVVIANNDSNYPKHVRIGSGAHQVRTITTYEQGWPVLQHGIDKLIGLLEGVHYHQFTSDEYMNLYTTVYNICIGNNSDSQKLYDQYKKTFEEYIISKVLPALRVKKGESLLQELVKRWDNHRVMTRWLSRFFYYLERYSIPEKNLPTLLKASHLIFYKLIYGEMNDQVRDAVTSMIDQEGEGKQIDHALVKNVLDIYVEIGEGSTEYYEKDIEEALLKQATSFYSQKASIWITGESYDDYVLKVDGYLKQEQNSVSSYLPKSSQKKLLEVVENQLPSIHASSLKEKKQLDSE